MQRYKLGDGLLFAIDGEWVRYADYKAEVEAMLGVCKTHQKDCDEANAAYDALKNTTQQLRTALEEIASSQVHPWNRAREVLKQVYSEVRAQPEAAQQNIEAIEKVVESRTAPYPHAWQCRVVEERDQLARRLADLRAYLKKDVALQLSFKDCGLLVAQSIHMDSYLDVLNKRIEAFHK